MATRTSFDSVNNSSANNRNNIRPIKKYRRRYRKRTYDGAKYRVLNIKTETNSPIYHAENAAKAYKAIIDSVISHIEENHSVPFQHLEELKNRVSQVEKDFPGKLADLILIWTIID